MKYRTASACVDWLSKILMLPPRLLVPHSSHKNWAHLLALNYIQESGDVTTKAITDAVSSDVTWSSGKVGYSYLNFGPKADQFDKFLSRVREVLRRRNKEDVDIRQFKQYAHQLGRENLYTTKMPLIELVLDKCLTCWVSARTERISKLKGFLKQCKVEGHAAVYQRSLDFEQRGLKHMTGPRGRAVQFVNLLNRLIVEQESESGDYPKEVDFTGRKDQQLDLMQMEISHRHVSFRNTFFPLMSYNSNVAELHCMFSQCPKNVNSKAEMREHIKLQHSNGVESGMCFQCVFRWNKDKNKSAVLRFTNLIAHCKNYHFNNWICHTCSKIVPNPVRARKIKELESCSELQSLLAKGVANWTAKDSESFVKWVAGCISNDELPTYKFHSEQISGRVLLRIKEDTCERMGFSIGMASTLMEFIDALKSASPFEALMECKNNYSV
uniref:C2H2-type domain-containing protein n=1 Tax=Ditylenchus dipsaci TaxID=166011 RepID=A0A915EAX3_9BILA